MVKWVRAARRPGRKSFENIVIEAEDEQQAECELQLYLVQNGLELVGQEPASPEPANPPEPKPAGL